MRWIWIAATLLVVSGLGAVVYVLGSGRVFQGRIEGMRAALEASQQAHGAPHTVVPEIMRAYARRAGGTENGPTLFHARQRAMLVPEAGKPPIAIEADQWTGTATPGLVWQARGTMSGLPIMVVDSYVDGSGLLEVRILGSFLVSGGSGADYDKGELMRYLSELPTYPDAILNAAGLAWRQLDERTVEVGAQSRSGDARVRFIFNTDGDIVRMEADDRPMTVNGGTVPTRWIGSYAAYRQFGSYRLPAHGEVGWVVDGSLQIYWKGELVSYEGRLPTGPISDSQIP